MTSNTPTEFPNVAASQHGTYGGFSSDWNAFSATIPLQRVHIAFVSTSRRQLPEDEPSLEQKFRRLANCWQGETGHLSSITKKSFHPAYIHIIGMGPAVVPILLRELRVNPDHWFFALYAITEEDPVKPEDAGDVEKMAQSWLEWGKQRGMI